MLRSYLIRAGSTDKVLRPFSRLGLSPNCWTVLALAFAFIGAAALAAHQLAQGLVLFLLSGFLDMVDGAVARERNLSSARGAFLDGVLDRYVELLLFLGLMAYLGEGASYLSISAVYWILLLTFGALMTSFVRAYADHRGLVKDPEELRRMGGLLERAERLLLLYIGMALGLFRPDWLLVMIALTALLSNATTLQRMAYALSKG
ncbi:MAG: CDP-alcohol phosphatidyltransferase family protein [Methanotrichaceae archaeon]|nr:CDP-alcohol phosphatidyltransferase family protein [Methanotrichaceae archaeon]